MHEVIETEQWDVRRRKLNRYMMCYECQTYNSKSKFGFQLGALVYTEQQDLYKGPQKRRVYNHSNEKPTV